MRNYYIIIFFSFIGIVQEHTDRYVQTLQNFQNWIALVTNYKESTLLYIHYKNYIVILRDKTLRLKRNWAPLLSKATPKLVNVIKLCYDFLVDYTVTNIAVEYYLLWNF